MLYLPAELKLQGPNILSVSKIIETIQQRNFPMNGLLFDLCKITQNSLMASNRNRS